MNVTGDNGVRNVDEAQFFIITEATRRTEKGTENLSAGINSLHLSPFPFTLW